MSLATTQHLTYYGGQMPEYLTIEHLTLQEIANFFSKVEISKTHFYGTSPCWEWQASTSHNGYGIWSLNRRTERAHRVMYAWLIAPIPRGLGKHIPQLDHLCNNNPCVNPCHLALKTAKENNQRSQSSSANNARKTHCKNGHPFTEENIYKINRDNRRICRTCALQYQNRKYATDPKFATRKKQAAAIRYAATKAQAAILNG